MVISYFSESVQKTQMATEFDILKEVGIVLKHAPEKKGGIRHSANRE